MNRGMKDGGTCWMVERHENGQLIGFFRFDFLVDGRFFEWTLDPNRGLHLADQQSCAQIADSMPDSWDIRIAEHKWLDGGTTL